jgi:hypothetical protein
MSARTTTLHAPEEGLSRALSDELDLTFTPLHKRCLGVAVGIVTGALLFGVTIVHLLRAGAGEPYPLILLQQYFPGYRVSLGGAFIGLVWGAWVGFVIGWFFAFTRNLVMTTTAFVFRARAEIAQSGRFLDHL